MGKGTRFAILARNAHKKGRMGVLNSNRHLTGREREHDAAAEDCGGDLSRTSGICEWLERRYIQQTSLSLCAALPLEKRA